MSPQQSQAVRFDHAASAVLSMLDSDDAAKVLAAAQARIDEWGLKYHLSGLDSQRTRAALAGCRDTYYSDVITSNREGSDGTVVRWMRAWAEAGLPPLDVGAILGLEGPDRVVILRSDR